MSWWETPLFRLGDSPVTVLSVIILSVTVLVSAIGARALRAGLVRVLRRGGATDEGRAYSIGRIVEYLVFTGGILIGLENVGVSLTALAAVGAVLSVGIGFGLQNIAQNFISGVILLIERPVSQGDVIQVGENLGRVEEIGLRATRVLTFDGISVLVPNSRLISEDVRNLQLPTSRNRLRVGVGVAYGSDLSLVRKILGEVAGADRRVLTEPAPRVFFQSFGDSSLDFELAVWIDDAWARPIVASDLRFAIDAAFRRHGVTIPFPQRDLHLVSGLPGRASEEA
ncbi:MAG: mechanosensitive ion channel [Myxococcales bacterium]|nr:mechanosensitive ion channel [Myxococcales bacterium]